MKQVRRLAAVAVVALAAAAAGCGGAKYAAVSGVVTVNGKPYKNAVVSFQPVSTAGNQEPGRGSSGVTDEQGRFTLKGHDGRPGAVVGKHIIRITTQSDSGVNYDPNLGSPDGDPRAASVKPPVEPIPPSWNADSKVEFEVPPGGTDQANFNIDLREK